MAEAKQEVDWNHTASIMAQLANVNQQWAKRPKAYHPLDYHPWADRIKKKRPKQMVSIDCLKVFVPQERK